jgi:nucleoside-diphosphate-sugar epimerase
MHAAVNGTKAMLHSAAKAGPQLESLVLLSSIVAVLNNKPAPYTLTESDWNDWAEGLVAAKGKEAGGPAIYFASKTAAERAFWAFRGEKKPGFNMTALNPV